MKTVTAILVALVIIGLTLYDLIAYLSFGYDSTITAVVRDTTGRYPLQALILAFALGVATCHLLGWNNGS